MLNARAFCQGVGVPVPVSFACALCSDGGVWLGGQAGDAEGQGNACFALAHAYQRLQVRPIAGHFGRGNGSL